MRQKSMIQPLVSILMPAYNADPYIEKAIDSILNQSYRNIELLICNDGSTDNTIGKINNYKDNRIKLYDNEINIGNLRTINKLFSLCVGDFITFQDADDWSDESRIEMQLNCFHEAPRISACGTQSVKFMDCNKIIEKSKFFLTHADIYKAMPKDFSFQCSSVMIKREVYECIGGFPEFFDKKGGADWYWVSLIINRFEFVNLSQCLYYYRYNQNSITNRKPISCDNYIIGRVVVFLIQQRRAYGSDGLMQGGVLADELFKYIGGLESEYLSDAGLLMRQYGIRLFFHKKYLQCFFVLMKNLLLYPVSSVIWYIKLLLKISIRIFLR
jgi:Glycosyltransferases involved in cell wall biogenesis